MARVQIPIAVLDPATGNAVSGATVTVTLRSTGGAASVYSSETGGSSGTNILTTDSAGRISPAKWVERGAYNLSVTGTGLTTYAVAWDAAPAGDGTVETTWLSPGGVQTSDIADGNVTIGKLEASALPTYYSSLPSGTSWAEGQIITLPATSVIGTTNVTASLWTFRWNSTSSRWDFVGGAPGVLQFGDQYGGSSQTITSTTDPMTAVTGCSVPFANKGKFQVLHAQDANAAGTTQAGYYFGWNTSATAAATGRFLQTAGGATTLRVPFSARLWITDITTASTTYNGYARAASGGTGSQVIIQSGQIIVTPVYLTP